MTDSGFAHKSLLTFKIDDDYFGVSIQSVVKVIKITRADIHDVPIKCQNIVGLYNFWGDVVTVCCFDGINIPKTKDMRLIILSCKSDRFGILADVTSDLLGRTDYIHKFDLEFLPEHTKYCEQVITYNNKTVWVLDANMLFEACVHEEL